MNSEIFGTVGGNPHVCKTYDGKEIHLGLRVRDYDNKVGIVVDAPYDNELSDPVCWPQAGHRGHWWMVCSDRDGHKHTAECRYRSKSFDGSRMTTRGVTDA